MLSRSILAHNSVVTRSLARSLASSVKISPNQLLVSQHVKDVDPEIFEILNKEKNRQKHSITLIPSENFTSKSVMDLLGSEMQNKYSEGYPGQRYYGGNSFIDESESLCQKRALDLYDLDPEKWGVNVQSLSGAPANLYAYSAILNIGDRLMGLYLPDGGHLSHGYQLNNGTHISYISKYFQTMPYHVNAETGLIDYDMLEKTSKLFRPKVIVAGTSAYARTLDYKRFKDITSSINAYLLSDMSHISGLVAAKVLESPFEYSDIVTTTTHKSLRGPRGAMIFYRKGKRILNPKSKKPKEVDYDLDFTLNFSVFPGHQGGPHNHTISAMAVALKQAKSKEFIDYQFQIVENSKHFAKCLMDKGYNLVSNGTDTHLILIDLSKTGIDGARLETILDKINIAANKNTIPGDKSALFPSGLRVGTPAMTTRGFGLQEFEKVAEYIDRAAILAKQLMVQEKETKLKKDRLADFKRICSESTEVKELAKEVSDWVGTYPVPGEM
ncbi:hypothetical protein TBLA_0F03390 [Henningerozyma blattae CBS 6284]|uniref:Serine hydroxymethyltransferase n=1 Tax=Henningerozyma blattae (strain ATCC 34711 / CBS 6284 / DSM 70876 / NBRC 10599 / NRRL Y-10934 / UCD 77-7) TaxID=1071380 RepID=I2H674_HENB6|nr:hypothetical protein TBLA_0F03390 [Tetrapisispora blattae CBS 6284]CCH61876.1 hypothetical protein TBLA_0F03390 [Tetrapisispora blattae CBS 6284]